MNQQSDQHSIGRRGFLVNSSAAILVSGVIPNIGLMAQVSVEDSKGASEEVHFLQRANLAKVPIQQLTDHEIVTTYAISLPDTAWRRSWNESDSARSRIRKYLKKMEGQYLRERRSSYVKKDGAVDREALGKLVSEFQRQNQHQIEDWKRNFVSLESGGQRIVDGDSILKARISFWDLLDCKTYCFEILRRGADRQVVAPADIKSKGLPGAMISLGFHPVRDPQDFDVVVYGNLHEENGLLVFGGGHYGMLKDGLVVSKDITSNHVYKHPVEESAAYTTHVMYFRHMTHPDPRDFPLPAPMGSLQFQDVGGIATPIVDSMGDLARFAAISAAILAGWLLLTSRISKGIFSGKSSR